MSIDQNSITSHGDVLTGAQALRRLIERVNTLDKGIATAIEARNNINASIKDMRAERLQISRMVRAAQPRKGRLDR